MRTQRTCRLLAAVLLLPSAAAFAAAEVVPVSATVKVRPKAPIPSATPASLVAARNEFLSFQVVVHADGAGAQGVTASLPGLEGPGKIGADEITLYREGYLDLTELSFPTATAGRYPDPLIPDVDVTAKEARNAFPFDVPANESRVIWVDVLVPKDAPPGLYQGAVKVTGGGVDATVPVTLSVVDAVLPSTSSLDTAFLFHRYEACQVHTGNSECASEAQSFEVRDMYLRMGLEHRITLSNTLTYPSDGDWAAFDERYAPWLDGTVKTRLPGARMTTAQYPGKREAAPLAAFEEHFDEKGWLDRAYDYTGDEPPWGISFAEAKSRTEMVKQAAPKLRALLTTTVQAADENGISGSLDLIVPVINHMDGTEAPYLGDQRKAYDGFLSEAGNALWVYQSCMSHGCAYGSNAPENGEGKGWPSYMVDASAARNRAMQWVVFLEDATGELYYETALALTTAWESIFRFNGNGDGTLFYPGVPARIGGTTHVPLPSLRLKQIRQGMQDYEWLRLVSEAGDPAFARKVARTLIPAAHQVGDDGAAFDQARLQLINRWLDLKGVTAPSPTTPGEVIPPGASPTVGSGPGGGATLDGSGNARADGGGGCAAAGGLSMAGVLLPLVPLWLGRRRRRR